MSSRKREEFAEKYAKRMKAGQSKKDDDPLRGREMSDDPMLEYFRQKEKEERGDRKELPRYRGHFPPNRHNIRPGYRWDGVDRSNGYEKRLLERESKKRAREEESYRNATRDM